MLDADEAQDQHDGELARRAAAGDRAALTELLARHQQWVYAVALRFARDPAAAADLAQDALLRVVTRMAQFEAKSSFRTWAWRIVLHTFLNARRSRSEESIGGFDDYAQFLERTGLADEARLEPPQLRAMLSEEVRLQCMLGMLLCLDREQRLVFILGAVLAVPAPVAAELFGWTPAQFRKRLERARTNLRDFMAEHCGLMNPANPCRCPKKTAALVERGLVDPTALRFAGPAVRVLEAQVPVRTERFSQFQADPSVALFWSHPDWAGPDLAQSLSALLEAAGVGELPPGGSGRH